MKTEKYSIILYIITGNINDIMSHLSTDIAYKFDFDKHKKKFSTTHTF